MRDFVSIRFILMDILDLTPRVLLINCSSKIVLATSALDLLDREKFWSLHKQV